jgi:tetratricopeptide (TPR) repeat protein
MKPRPFLILTILIFIAEIHYGLTQNKPDESQLRSAIALNPKSAQNYDQLAGFLAPSTKRLEEARTIELKAIELDPGNVHYRVRLAGILLSENKLEESRTVLVDALKIATNPDDSAILNSRIRLIDSLKKLRNESENGEQAHTSESAEATGPVVASGAPQHPQEPATGSVHAIDGVIQNVTCSYPLQIDLSVASVKKKYTLYNNNYTKIEFSELGFKSTDKLEPCKTMEGLRAHVVYAESSDKTVDGQVISILLKK